MTTKMRAVLVGVAMALTACGGGDIECGEGTVEMDGTCVPNGSDIMCGTGTVLDTMSNNCVLEGEASTCGTGTTRNAMTGACEPDVECGAGTSAMGGECVPDGSMICADGTRFDMASGTCLPNDDLGTCADGTTLIDGECVPNDDTLMGETFAAAEPDDPAFDGTPATFIPPGIDMEVTAEGCITPADFDMDDTTDVDRDFFAFSVADPGLFRINVDGLGGLAASFVVVATDGPLSDQGWARYGLNYAGDTSERQVYLPRAGNYAIVVFDARSFDPASQNFTTPVGNTDTCYFMTVEALAVPTPTAITDGMANGQLSNEPQFFTFTSTGRATQFIRLIESAPNAVAGLVTDSSGTILTRSSAAVGAEQEAIIYPNALNDGESVLVVVETVLSTAVDPVAWRLEFEAIPELPNDGSLTFTNDPDALFGQLAFVELTAGDVVHLTTTSVGGDGLVVLFVNPNFGGLSELCDDCTDTDDYFVVETTGTHLVVFENVDADDDATYEVSSTVRTQTPPTLTADTASTITLADTRTFVRVDTSSLEWARFDLTDFMGMAFDDVFFGFLPDQPGRVGAPFDGAPSVSDTLSRIYGIEFGAPALIELRDPDSFDGDESLSFTFGSETFTDVTAAPGSDYTESATAVSDTAPVYYFVRGARGGELTFTVTGLAGTDPSLSLLDFEAADASGSPIDATGADGVESFTRVVGESGFFAFAVSAAAPGTVDVSISQGDPPFTESVGTTTFASVCPAAGGSGTVIPFLGGNDDSASALVTFPTFSGFEFFGAPVTTYQVSTNGFLSFQAAPIATETYINDLGVDDAQNAVIAPFWYDLFNVQACLLEEAGRAIFEWSGDGYSYLDGSSLGRVQFQVILTSATDTIEFVYGPSHSLGRNPAGNRMSGSGLENQDGSVTQHAAAAPAANTAVLFTPSM